MDSTELMWDLEAKITTETITLGGCDGQNTHMKRNNGDMPGRSQHILPLLSFCIQLIFPTAILTTIAPNFPQGTWMYPIKVTDSTLFTGNSNLYISLHEHLLLNLTSAARHPSDLRFSCKLQLSMPQASMRGDYISDALTPHFPSHPNAFHFHRRKRSCIKPLHHMLNVTWLAHELVATGVVSGWADGWWMNELVGWLWNVSFIHSLPGDSHSSLAPWEARTFYLGRKE